MGGAHLHMPIGARHEPIPVLALAMLSNNVRVVALAQIAAVERHAQPVTPLDAAGGALPPRVGVVGILVDVARLGCRIVYAQCARAATELATMRSDIVHV